MIRVLAIALTLMAPFSVMADGSRLTALDTDHEARGWEAVGRLDLGVGFCTATLIAPNLVLSAAHCVYDRSNQLVAADKITFKAGLRDGKAAATRQVAKIAAHPGYDPTTPLTNENVKHDMALLELAEPIPTHEINPFILHGDRVSPGKVSVVSYGRGREERQSRQRECGLLHRVENLLVFDCDVTFGSSGAPVFSHLNGRGRILSVISGGASLDGERIALGPHLPPLVETLKRALRSQTSAPKAKIRRIGTGGGALNTGSSSAKFVRVPSGS